MFDAGDDIVLDTIKKNHHDNADKCAAEMLKLWLTRKPEASWNHLLGVFREPHIQMNTFAKKIEEMLCKGTSSYLGTVFYFIFIVVYETGLM